MGRYCVGDVGKVKKEPPPGAAVPGGSGHQVGKDEEVEKAGTTDPSIVGS